MASCEMDALFVVPQCNTEQAGAFEFPGTHGTLNALVPCLFALQDHLLPEEYVVTMREHMLDKCPVSSYAEVQQIIKEDLGAPPEQLFTSFSQTPIASASLAQVSVQTVCWGAGEKGGMGAAGRSGLSKCVRQ
jgi:hypothetical protein